MLREDHFPPENFIVIVTTTKIRRGASVYVWAAGPVPVLVAALLFTSISTTEKQGKNTTLNDWCELN